jgi:hypothetical protein
MTIREKEPASVRRFGLMLTVLFAALTLYGFFLKSWATPVCIVLSGLGAACGVTTLLAPNALEPLNRAWFRLGHAIGRVVNPVVLSIIYFVLLTPIALIARMSGRDELRLQRRAVDSYWKNRIPPGPSPTSFDRQF